MVTDIFEPELKIKLKEKNNFDDNTVRKPFKMLDDKKMIVFKQTVDGNDIFEKSPEFSTILNAEKESLSTEEFAALENIFASDYKNFVQEKHKVKQKRKFSLKQRTCKDFKNLWYTINKNAFYVLDTLSEVQENQLIQNIKTQIEAVPITAILLQTVRAELNVNKLDKDDAVTKELKSTVSYKSKVDYLALVRTLSNNTKTPISFIVKIFNALSDDFKNKMLCNNPEQAQEKFPK